MDTMGEAFPRTLSPERRALLENTIRHLEATQGDALLGVVLTGSAARGLETSLSDLDVNAVFDHVDEATAPRFHSATLEVIPLTLKYLETVAAFGSPEWGSRWAFSWAPVLLDRTDGRIHAALERQTRLTLEETNDILVGHARLDAWINLLYRALKSARDGNAFEARLDGAESAAMLLEIVFALHGLVRPYNKYLCWALHHHPIPGWPADDLIDLVLSLMDGNASVMRRVYAKVQKDCARFDRRHGQEFLQNIFAGWDGELYDVLRR
jgi:hypothetical protein